jgi:hypothetical protein
MDIGTIARCAYAHYLFCAVLHYNLGINKSNIYIRMFSKIVLRGTNTFKKKGEALFAVYINLVRCEIEYFLPRRFKNEC